MLLLVSLLYLLWQCQFKSHYACYKHLTSIMDSLDTVEQCYWGCCAQSLALWLLPVHLKLSERVAWLCAGQDCRCIPNRHCLLLPQLPVRDTVLLLLDCRQSTRQADSSLYLLLTSCNHILTLNSAEHEASLHTFPLRTAMEWRISLLICFSSSSMYGNAAMSMTKKVDSSLRKLLTPMWQI